MPKSISPTMGRHRLTNALSNAKRKMDARHLYLFASCRDSLNRFQRRPSHTANRRRNRRTAAKSCDSMNKPNGIIQKPRIGRNPSIPQAIRSEPAIIRPVLVRGTDDLRFNFSLCPV